MMLYDILVVKIFNLILPFHFLWGKVSKGRLEHRGYHNSHIWKCEVACFLQLKNVLQIPWGFSRLLNVFFSIFSALSISNLSRLSVKKGHKSNSLPTTLCFLSKIRKKKTEVSRKASVLSNFSFFQPDPMWKVPAFRRKLRQCNHGMFW